MIFFMAKNAEEFTCIVHSTAALAEVADIKFYLNVYI